MKTNTKSKALVTGFSSGIGLAYSKYLALNNWELELVAQNPEKSEMAFNAIKNKDSTYHLADLSKPEGVEEITKKIKDPDLIIANAGITMFGEVGSINKEDRNDLEAIDKLMSAKIFACPSLTLARTTRASGGKVWFYQFNRKRINDVSDRMGAYHGAELPYVFDKHDDWLPTVDVDRSITRDMQKYWTNFAKFGDPNGDTLEHWQSFEVPERTVFYLGDNYKTESHPSEKFCQYL